MAEIKENQRVWRTGSIKHKVSFVLMIDGVPFSYSPETEIEFRATPSYVEKLKERLVNAYGASLKPVIEEVK